MTKGRVNILYFVPVVVVAVLIGSLFLPRLFQDQDSRDQLPSALQGKPVPGVQLTQLGTEKPFENSDLKDGTVKLVNFWASWCGPCRAEHPNLELLASEGVVIYGINYKDQPDKALKFIEELGNPYARLGADQTGRTALDWGLYGVPETYVIDGKGNIILRFAGPITQRVLESTIRPALENAR